MTYGKVYLVGAGPGDKRLITVKGLQCIQRAEVILYDRLVNPLLLEEAQDNVELIYCGKLPQQHTLRQEKINDLLVAKSKEGKMVVRLKGGDPSVFGRVGEEAEILVKNGIDFEIVPGITSGIAASAYAGIPVTHRDYATSFAIVTGHQKSKDGKPKVNWASLASSIDTIAFYMGVGNLDYIANQLVLHGKPATTPVILIQWGTYSDQKTLEGTLENISRKASEENFQNPAITLVGSIVTLREKLKWFEKMPLHGKNIIVARATAGEVDLAAELIEQGADVFQFPRFTNKSLLFDITTIKKFRKLSFYDQILFTCPTSVEQFFKGLTLYGIDIRNIKAEFFVKTRKTDKQLKKYGCSSRRENELSLLRNLLIIGAKTSAAPSAPLKKRLDYLATHQLVPVEHSFETLKRLEMENRLNTVVFPSVKSISVLLHSLTEATIDPFTFFQDKKVITFGENSYLAAVKAGLAVDCCLEEQPTVECLIDALRKERVSV
ncbi:MAG: uroporphyrinogen-III C-methyltransferase [Anaerobacillus sp.]|uniref:uroporphyrinogen-III C-methyltransferase n=1 Tax=Anaerobacillus sp. TaxID=1872506 RepID=UPI00391CE3A2